MNKLVFKQFTSEFQCFEKIVFERNCLAKRWRETWKPVSFPIKNLVWSTLIKYVERKKRHIVKKDSSTSSSQDFLFNLEGTQWFETHDAWILEKDNIIAWTVPARLNFGGKFFSAEFVKEDGDVFGFIEDKQGNVYVFPQEESINYGYTGSGPLALIYSLTSLIENGLQSEVLPQKSSDLREKIAEKVYFTSEEENLTVRIDQL